MITIYYMNESLKKAQKRYMNKKISEGWIHIRFFIPTEIKKELMESKTKIMKKYWETHNENIK